MAIIIMSVRTKQRAGGGNGVGDIGYLPLLLVSWVSGMESGTIEIRGGRKKLFVPHQGVYAQAKRRRRQTSL